MTETPHVCFTASATSYLRNLDDDDRRGECIAIHYQAPPVRNEETGSTSFSLNYPLLVVSLYAGKPQEVADRVAAILNAHWDTFEMPETEALS